MIGASQMDLYCGALTLPALFEETMQALHRLGATSQAAYEKLLVASGHYLEIHLSDGSRWVLRYAANRDHYIHLHPGRYAAHTIRVKAAVLKTAIAWKVYHRHDRFTTIDLSNINQLRKEIGLPPVKTLEESRHLTGILSLLEN
ncbi:hypothetical protein [Chitinophaga vietnamensis]|uniref:hypothetical protein n=1 Tax=Chitinophaga vietnamensis TaxID=2593957 RepID=UPI00117754D3|nr:hypothetical protein [Chitinophaga vietnamensis]